MRLADVFASHYIDTENIEGGGIYVTNGTQIVVIAYATGSIAPGEPLRSKADIANIYDDGRRHHRNKGYKLSVSTDPLNSASR